MKTKFIFILALVIVLSAFALSQYDAITDVYANDDKCEDGFTCYWAFHVDKPEQKDRCTHKENNQWRFYVPLRPCGDSDDKKPDDTSTPLPVVVDQPTATKQNAPTALPTATKQNDAPVPVQSTATQQSGNRNNPTVTLTPTYISGESPNQICNWCSLAEREAAAQETQAAAQATIAAGLSGGD